MKKVIIIDDIKHVLDEENSFLDRKSIEVYPIPSNTEALQVHREIRAHLIITYLDMPDMSGEEFCEQVRGDPATASASIIMICPKTKACYKRTKNCQANDFLPAPITADALLKKAQELLHIAERTMYRAPVSIQIKGESGKPFLGFCENISASGMLLGTDRKLKKGGQLLCSFFLESDGHVKVEGEVTRAVGKPKKGAPNHYGIAFTNITPGIVAEIDRFVQKIIKGK
jgi:DNA-binding response OmpR family regulator